MVTTTIKFNIPKQKAEELSRAALSYGFSLNDLFKKVFSELKTSIGEESWSDYSAATKASFKRALNDLKTGRVSSAL
ncbi:MAG: hypothetical protein AAB863_03045 [Patescibacteria group bacterium]